MSGKSSERNERLIAQWQDQPYTSVNKRYIKVQHRIVANWYPGVGADIRHEIKCEERGVDDWTTAETWEMRDHGVQKMQSKEGRALP